MPPERHRFPGDVYGILAAVVSAGGKLTHFIELRIVRQRDLRHYAKHMSVLNNRSAVIKLAQHSQWKPHGSDTALSERIIAQCGERVNTSAQKYIRIKEIAAGICRKEKLRQDKEICPNAFRLIKTLFRLCEVINCVAHAKCGTRRRDFDKSVFHDMSASCVLFATDFKPHPSPCQHKIQAHRIRAPVNGLFFVYSFTLPMETPSTM